MGFVKVRGLKQMLLRELWGGWGELHGAIWHAGLGFSGVGFRGSGPQGFGA